MAINARGGQIETLRKILREVKEINLLLKELKGFIDEYTADCNSKS